MNWISVEDRLPPKNCELLIFNGGEIQAGGYFEGEFYTTDPEIHTMNHYMDYDTAAVITLALSVTHWFLPDPPEVEDD